MFEKMNINEKLSTLKYNKFKESHLIVDNEICRECKEKFCTYICPADVYEWNDKISKLTIRYENCLECGACKIACGKKNIKWSYPPAQYGVKFKNG